MGHGAMDLWIGAGLFGLLGAYAAWMTWALLVRRCPWCGGHLTRPYLMPGFVCRRCGHRAGG
jgi:hypothetical protein